MHKTKMKVSMVHLGKRRRINSDDLLKRYDRGNTYDKKVFGCYDSVRSTFVHTIV